MQINCIYVLSCNVKNPTNVDHTKVTAVVCKMSHKPPSFYARAAMLCGIYVPDALTPFPFAEGMSELIALKLVY